MNTTDLKKLAKCSDKGHRVHQALEHSHSGVHVAEKKSSAQFEMLRICALFTTAFEKSFGNV
jgi:hypothetical protein